MFAKMTKFWCSAILPVLIFGRLTLESTTEECHNNNTIFAESTRIMKPLMPGRCLDITSFKIKPDLLKEFFPHVQTMLANDINLTTFPSKFLKKFPILENIDMSKNKIRILSRKLDLYVPKLKKLNLAENRLRIPKKGSLTKSASLEILILSKNKIKRLNSELFHALPSLKVLYLDGNFLISLKVHPFRKLHHLELLHLGGNRLESIPPLKAFEKVSKRVKVIYKGNKIRARSK